MAKSDKFSKKVPSLADYKAPWVKEDGTVDVEAAKKAFHTLMVDKAKAQDAREDALSEKQEVTSQVADLQTKLDDKSDPDTKAELDKARAAQAKAEGERDEANLRADRVEIAAEKGLTPAQAKRLVGKDRDELEADADELVKDLGIEPKSTDEENEGDEQVLRTQPRTPRNLTNGGDPKNGADAEPDYDAIAAQLTQPRGF